jgi:uncharacterized protein (TIGR03382 family)
MLPLHLALAHAATWGPCVGFDTAEQAECTILTVPEDYGAIGDAVSLVNVTVARVPSAAPATRHVWITAPEPGGAALAELTRWAERPLPDDVELYAVDHRGVGANRLTCPDQEALDSPGGSRIEAEEIGPCSAFLASQVDALAFVDTTQSGADLMEVSERLKDGATEVFFVGSGYGAFLVQRALVLSGRPEGVILDGPWPDDASLSEHDAGLDDLARGILAACEDDDACLDRLDDGPGELIASFLDDPAACDGFTSAADARRIVASVAKGPPELQGMLPAVLQRSVRCTHDDLEALLFLRSALDAWEDHPGTSGAAELHLAYGELWRSDAPSDLGFLASTGRSSAMDRGVADWSLPFAPSAPRYPDHERPMLLLHPERAPLSDRDVGDRYPWVEHHQVDVPGAFGAATETPCGQQLVLDFLDAPEAPPAPCEAKLDFEGSPAADARWLGVDDRWGRGGCGCQGGGPTTSAWLLLGALGLVSRRAATPGSRSRR